MQYNKSNYIFLRFGPLANWESELVTKAISVVFFFFQLLKSTCPSAPAANHHGVKKQTARPPTNQDILMSTFIHYDRFVRRSSGQLDQSPGKSLYLVNRRLFNHVDKKNVVIGLHRKHTFNQKGHDVSGVVFNTSE